MEPRGRVLLDEKDARPRALDSSPLGSGVIAKSRLRWYSRSPIAASSHDGSAAP